MASGVHWELEHPVSLRFCLISTDDLKKGWRHFTSGLSALLCTPQHVSSAIERAACRYLQILDN